ncbi:DUF5994 family protein [Streptomyces xanthophaeus]
MPSGTADPCASRPVSELCTGVGRTAQVVPHTVAVDGRTLHVGWFTEQGPSKLVLLAGTGGRPDLLVVPPRTAPATASRLPAAAARTGGVEEWLRSQQVSRPQD